MGRRGAVGDCCEKRAVRFLEERGYIILERNYRSPFGEIDIVARDGDSIVFIEVKSRTSPLFGPPYLKVNRLKRAHIIRCALSYLKKYYSVETKCRIDVISISLDKREDQIEHIKNAFDADHF